MCGCVRRVGGRGEWSGVWRCVCGNPLGSVWEKKLGLGRGEGVWRLLGLVCVVFKEWEGASGVGRTMLGVASLGSVRVASEGQRRGGGEGNGRRRGRSGVG